MKFLKYTKKLAVKLSKKNEFLLSLYIFGARIKGYMFRNMPDDVYLKRRFRDKMGKELNLDSPQTYSEKLQWLKLYDRRPEYTIMVDKYAVKKYVAKKIGKQYIIPTLGVWKKFDDIDFNKLPNQFVLKCTHDSGGLVICKDKSKFDKKAAKRKINACLKRNFYYGGREWPYKNVKPRIIAEKYMTDESGVELKDYKIFNFNGEPKLIQVDFDRFIEHKRNIYDTDWKYIDIEWNHPTDPNYGISKPKSLDEMLNLARILSDGIPHARTDFYVINDKIFFGEITFFPSSGFLNLPIEEWNLRLGEMIILPKKRR